MSGITIISPGPLTTVQDLGRNGYLNIGVCPSGVMDVPSARLANVLAGNALDSQEPMPAVLEMTLQGVTCTFDDDTDFALTGADMPAELNGSAIKPYTLIRAKAGNTLSVGFAGSGCRGYLAFAGGIAVPLVMGSRSTFIRCGFGGFMGRKLMRGDHLDLYGSGGRPRPRKLITIATPARYDSPRTVRLTDGPQIDKFSKDIVRDFLRAEYTVSAQSDRMGIRLDGPLVKCEGGSDIVSDGIPLGAMQITNSGQPVILLADRQTVGGYTKPFVVIEADLPLLAQCRPGDTIRFARISARQAQLAALDQMATIGGLMRRIEETYTGTMRLAGFTVRS